MVTLVFDTSPSAANFIALLFSHLNVLNYGIVLGEIWHWPFLVVSAGCQTMPDLILEHVDVTPCPFESRHVISNNVDILTSVDLDKPVQPPFTLRKRISQ